MPRQPSTTRRRPPKRVVVLSFAADNGAPGGVDCVTVERQGRGSFDVVTRRDATGGGRKLCVERTAGIAEPGRLEASIEAIAIARAAEIDWAVVTACVAGLDWVAGAVIAKRRGVAVPALPGPDVLLAQRSATWLGRVRLGAEWGYEIHDLYLPFLVWVRLLHGEPMELRSRYGYEGQRFVAEWSFNHDWGGPGSLWVRYDGDADGWREPFRDLSVIQGREVEGLDLADLAIEGVPALHDDPAG